MQEGDGRAGRATYAGLFMVALATLFYEVLLTRIFSVVMWYHFAFMAISIAMFGMTVGAVLVYRFSNFFTQELTKRHLSAAALLFCLSIPLSFMTQQSIPFVVDTSTSIISYYSICLTYAVISVPFIFSGICICLALTRFPRQVNSLYAADLIGAALGCLFLVLALEVTDGPTSVLIVSACAGLAAVCFALEQTSRRLRLSATLVSLALIVLSVAHAAMVNIQEPVFRLLWVKNELEKQPLYEAWNSHSRVTVRGNPNGFRQAKNHFFQSTQTPDRFQTQTLLMMIDIIGATELTRHQWGVTDHGYARWRVTNMAHHLRPDADVLVIGVGGGDDIRAALEFEQKSVVGVEMNGVVLDILTNQFGDFAGHLERDPRVTLVHDEGRSFVTRMNEKVDIIQMTGVDTFAATAAGAFALGENGLYTIEAWKTLLERLKPNGILTATRFHVSEEPLAMYRTTALASAALQELGVDSPRRHIMALHSAIIGTILVSPDPFSDADIATFSRLAGEMKFPISVSPKEASNAEFEAAAAGHGLATVEARLPVDLSPPTDDRPFFFHMLKLGAAFQGRTYSENALMMNVDAIRMLAILLVCVAILTALFILGPLATARQEVRLSTALPFVLFFAFIGSGFMLVEMALMQRFIVFLGHPTYAFVVVLFSLLLACGLGSQSTRLVRPSQQRRGSLVRLACLLGALVLFGVLAPGALTSLRGASNPIRILTAVVILCPLGFVMGMPFPLGMRIASEKSPLLTPWFWAINGATSVLASVVSVALSLSWGITVSYCVGCACYVGATLCFLAARRA